eukprot:TRINITY_DN3233_c0_g2_i1.p1 TRINITY_DN3233_c0_g2~~TRINITY_DN3233_c0_g2_i1.p1  ORF type:complete len:104 (+),score=22.09 TRINITY_DN3233_c0_g2_i1:42-314(+)
MSYVSIHKREAMIQKLIGVIKRKVVEPPQVIENNVRTFEQKILNEHNIEADYINALNSKIKSLEYLRVGPHSAPTPHTRPTGFEDFVLKD